MAKEKSKSGMNEEEFEWNADREVQLFYALRGHKPVGVNRYFEMIFIQDEFNKLIGKEVTTNLLWKHLDTIYDMEALHENEDLPFSNEETDFSLPQEYFGSNKMEEVVEEEPVKEVSREVRETKEPKEVKEVKEVKESGKDKKVKSEDNSKIKSKTKKSSS